MEKSMGLSCISDWKKVKQSDIERQGGQALLRYYDWSLQDLICNFYPEFFHLEANSMQTSFKRLYILEVCQIYFSRLKKFFVGRRKVEIENY
jgi:hypothetical protein